MTMLEKQREKEAAPQRVEFPPPKQRKAWIGFAVVAIVAAALAVVIGLIVTDGGGDEALAPVELGPAITIYTADESALMTAVAGGLVPTEALESDLFKTKQLVNEGYLPFEAMVPQSIVSPLYSPEERAFLRAAADGLVPAAAIETDLLKTKRLVNEGLLPPEVLE